MSKLKLLAVSALTLFATHALAAKDSQSALISKATTLASKGQINEACQNFYKAYGLGYQGNPKKSSDPKENKTYVKAALEAAACMERERGPFDYDAATVYHDLSGNYNSKEAHERLNQMQQISLKEASLLKSHGLQDFTKANAATNNACKHAEFGYYLGFLGTEDQKKDEKANAGYVINGIYHSTCMSLNPNFFLNGDPEVSRLHAISTLEGLASEYGSSFAAKLLDAQ